ncbi:MAG: MFS transporter [Aeromicrobium sp.]
MSAGTKAITLSVVFVLLALVVGMTFYSTSVYLDRLTVDGRFTVTQVAFGATLSSLAGGVAGLGVARLLRTTRIRLLLVLGGLGSFLAMCALGASQEPWQLWAAYIALGAAGSLIGALTLTELLARTFRPTPGPAITIASSGMSIGGALIPPIVAVVLDQLGVLMGSVAIGAAILVIATIAAIVVVEPPRIPQDPQSPQEDVAVAPALRGGGQRLWSWLRRNRPTPVMVLLMIGFGLLIMSQNATMIHILRLATDRGIGGAEIALSVVAATSFVSRFIGMGVLTRVGIRWFALAIALCQAAAQCVLAGATDITHLLVGAMLLGITVGNVFVLSSLFVLSGFSLAQYAGVYALVSLAMTLGGAIGPLVLALGATFLGSYFWPLVAVGIGSALGGVALVASRIDSDPRADRARRRAEREERRRAAEAAPEPAPEPEEC